MPALADLVHYNPTSLGGHLTEELWHRVKKIVFPMRLITNMKINYIFSRTTVVCKVMSSGLYHFKWELNQNCVKQEIKKC